MSILVIGKRELVALLSLSSWCLVMVVWLFLAVPRFVIVVFPDHTHLLTTLVFVLCGYCKKFHVPAFNIVIITLFRIYT